MYIFPRQTIEGSISVDVFFHEGDPISNVTIKKITLHNIQRDGRN